MPLHLLLPDASQLSAIESDPPLGSILVLELDSLYAFGALVDASSFVRQHPWCPLVVLCAEELAAGEIARMTVAPSTVVIARSSETADGWRQAVRCRPNGGRAACLAYLRLRLSAEAVELVRIALEDFTEGSSVRRRLRRARLPAPMVWQDLFDMCDCLTEAIAVGCTQAQMAARLGSSATTLSRRCARLFGETWPCLVAQGSCEAVMECGLRHLGVVSLPLQYAERLRLRHGPPPGALQDV